VLEDLSFTATVNGFSVFLSIGETNIEEREDVGTFERGVGRSQLHGYG
jgi:hypothetical protein